MKKDTQKSILFVGNHAIAHLENVRNYFKSKFHLNYIKYKSGDPFEDTDPNKIIINDLEMDYNGSYDLNNLTLAMSFILEQNSKLTKPDLIIGDPSELLFQAFSFARLRENPLFFKKNLNRISKADPSLNLFIYPMGMLCFDIRKEISNLIYVLKKHDSKTFLLRKDEDDLDTIINKILTDINHVSIYDIESDLEGLEHLTGKPKDLIKN